MNVLFKGTKAYAQIVMAFNGRQQADPAYLAIGFLAFVSVEALGEYLFGLSKAYFSGRYGDENALDKELADKFAKDKLSTLDLDRCLNWAQTPQGQAFWSRVHNLTGRAVAGVE